MKRILNATLTSAAVAAVLAAPLAQATNGYFKIGYGTKNRGMAGAGMAFGQDSIAGAVNPAALAFVDNRADAGVELFKPKRRGVLDATGIGGARSEESSRANAFFIPSMGFVHKWSNKVTLGISAVANGGLNTRYGDANAGNGNIFSDAFGPAVPGFTAATILQLGGDPTDPTDPITQQVGGNAFALGTNPDNTPALGVNLVQALLAPTLSYKITPNHAIGVGPVFGYQTFRAYGLGLFVPFSSDPDKLTNNGNDKQFGLGGRVGYQGNFGSFSFGAAATSKIYMEEFDDYAGLFAENGDFDVPATFGAGVAWRATSKLTIAADVSRILYGGVDSISNKGPTADELFAALGAGLAIGPGSGALLDKGLGKNDGWGFGWDDAWVYKVGVNYEYSSLLSLRVGYNYSEVPYDDDQALFNILAPAVVEHHATAGFTYSLNPGMDVSMTYMHAFRNNVDYTYNGTGAFAGFSYSAKNDMYQNAIEASFAWKF